MARKIHIETLTHKIFDVNEFEIKSLDKFKANFELDLKCC